MKNIVLYVFTYIFAISLDLIWLRGIASKFYIDSIGDFMRKQGGEVVLNTPSALLVYAIMSFGIIYFALPKSGNSYWGALVAGACYGFIIYGIYDFTNYALLANWPFKFSLIDISWGVLLCMLTTCFAYFIGTMLSLYSSTP
jgi:uncharacterized membrane protein